MMEPDDSILVAVLSCVSSAVLTWGRPFGLGRPPAHVGLYWINLLWADGQCSGPVRLCWPMVAAESLPFCQWQSNWLVWLQAGHQRAGPPRPQPKVEEVARVSGLCWHGHSLWHCRSHCAPSMKHISFFLWIRH